MGLLCDFCGKERSTVHCRSDAACLCLLCDRRVHSANDLSKRHWRTLLCDKCNSQPAVTWRLNDKISLCEICDFNDLHGQINSQDQLKINGYSGCPSTSVFSTIWSFAPDFDGLKSCHRGTITANNDDENEYNRSTTVDLLTDLEKVNAWIGSSTLECSPNKPLASDDSPAQNLQVNFNHAIQISNHHGSAYIYIYIFLFMFIYFSGETPEEWASLRSVKTTNRFKISASKMIGILATTTKCLDYQAPIFNIPRNSMR